MWFFAFSCLCGCLYETGLTLYRNSFETLCSFHALTPYQSNSRYIAGSLLKAVNIPGAGIANTAIDIYLEALFRHMKQKKDHPAVIFYRLQNMDLVRSWPETVRQTPATKRVSGHWGLANSSGKLLRQAFAPLLPNPKDIVMQRGLRTAIYRWLNASAPHQDQPLNHLADLSLGHVSGHAFPPGFTVSPLNDHQLVATISPAGPAADVSVNEAQEYLIAIVRIDVNNRVIMHSKIEQLGLDISSALISGHTIEIESPGRPLCLSIVVGAVKINSELSAAKILYAAFG
ncbi:MAG: hypothetical protein JWQ27_2502 [Ferruginibacter sp.]|nr:hypothetical protein [Ferruginibacter sp.]